MAAEVSEEPPPLAPPPSPSLDLPPGPSTEEPTDLPEQAEDVDQIDSSSPAALPLPPIATPPMAAEITEQPLAPPSLGEEIAKETPHLAPPPAPSLDLPPPPSIAEPPSSIEQTDDDQVSSIPELPPIAPPSTGGEIPEEPVSLAPPPAPSLELPPEPSFSASTEADSALPSPPKKPSLSLKPKKTRPGLSGKKGKPSLSLKSGKKKTGGLKITRPPMKPPSA